MTEVPLVSQHCRQPPDQPAMDLAEVHRHLNQLPGWHLVDGAIEQQFAFADFDRTMVFVNAVADLARAEDHHPTLLVSYNRCTLRFNTHSVQGISINDFICAAKVDVLRP